VDPVGPELVARQEAVLREVQEIAVAAAVRAVPVPVGRRVGRRVGRAAGLRATVPRGLSVRAARNESWVNPG